jgi:hypothetical protein
VKKEELIKEVLRLTKEKKSSYDISKELGISSGYVRDLRCQTENNDFGALEKAITAKVKPIKVPVPSQVGESLVIHLTDWHFGRLVIDGDGKPAFSLKIAKERAEDLCGKIISLAKNHITGGTKIADAIVLVTGDMCDGEGIYDGQAYETDAHRVAAPARCHRFLLYHGQACAIELNSSAPLAELLATLYTIRMPLKKKTQFKAL